MSRNWSEDGSLKADVVASNITGWRGSFSELGLPAADLMRHVGMSEQTFYRWKKQYAGLQPDPVGELKQLQEKNGKLKRLVAELSLDKAVL
jgi:putative transposase